MQLSDSPNPTVFVFDIYHVKKDDQKRRGAGEIGIT